MPISWVPITKCKNRVTNAGDIVMLYILRTVVVNSECRAWQTDQTNKQINTKTRRTQLNQSALPISLLRRSKARADKKAAPAQVESTNSAKQKITKIKGKRGVFHDGPCAACNASARPLLSHNLSWIQPASQPTTARAPGSS